MTCLMSAKDLTVGEKLNPRRIQSSCGKVSSTQLEPHLATELSQTGV